MKLNPLIVALKFHVLLLNGKVTINQKAPLSNAYPERFQPFLFVKIDTPQPTLAVRLLVKFKVHSLNIWQRFLLPVLSIPFFAGVPGFIDKTFLLNESENTFCGFYTWRSREEAEIYTKSYPGKLMAWNALDNALTMEISPIQLESPENHLKNSILTP